MAEIHKLGGGVLRNRRVVECSQGQDGQWTVVCIDGDGNFQRHFADHLISVVPLPSLAQMLRSHLSPQALAAAAALRSRASIHILLVCTGESSLVDGWVYVQEPRVKVGRIQKLDPQPDEAEFAPGSIAYGLEYFCAEGDFLWRMSDEQLVALAMFELEWLGLVKRKGVRDGCVVERQAATRPVSDRNHARHGRVIRDELGLNFRNLHLIGRNGTHQPVAPDSSMVAGLRVAQAIMEGVATTVSPRAQPWSPSCQA